MTSKFNATSTGDDIAKVYGENARGKVVMVTGANSGLGHETARVLAANGAKVVLICRTKATGESAASGIREAVPSADLMTMEMDMASLASVRKCAQEFLDTGLPLHILINNAGLMNTPPGTTQDGIEIQIGVNHFAHFVFTTLLLDRIKASAPARIINVSSNGSLIFQTSTGIDLNDLCLQKRAHYDRYNRYGQSKLANILFTTELQRRLGTDSGVLVASLHPGAILSTKLGRSMGPGNLVDRDFWYWFPALMGSLKRRRWINKTIPQGAAPSIFCALSSDVIPGEFYFDTCQVASAQLYQRHPLVDSVDAAKNLWEATEKVLKEVATKETK